MHDSFHCNLLFSFFLHLRFYQTDLDGLENNIHRYCFWLIYQCMPEPKTIFQNLAIVFIALILRVATLNFVQERFGKTVSPLMLAGC